MVEIKHLKITSPALAPNFLNDLTSGLEIGASTGSVSQNLRQALRLALKLQCLDGSPSLPCVKLCEHAVSASEDSHHRAMTRPSWKLLFLIRREMIQLLVLHEPEYCGM